MKQTLCSLFIGFSALAVSLAVPQGADAYTYCEYEDDCYFYENTALYYNEQYTYPDTALQSTSTYDAYCDEYYDGVDCYHYVYDRDVYTSQSAPAIQFNFPTYTQVTSPTYSYPVYTPVYVPTPITQTVQVPVTKTVTKTVYVPSTKKKKTGFTVTYSRGY